MGNDEDPVGPLLDPTEPERIKVGEDLNRALAALDDVKSRLRESEERVRALLSAPVAMFVCDRDGVIQYYNHRAVELLGARARARH